MMQYEDGLMWDDQLNWVDSLDKNYRWIASAAAGSWANREDLLNDAKSMNKYSYYHGFTKITDYREKIDFRLRLKGIKMKEYDMPIFYMKIVSRKLKELAKAY